MYDANYTLLQFNVFLALLLWYPDDDDHKGDRNILVSNNMR
jgi:hypothetical protein